MEPRSMTWISQIVKALFLSWLFVGIRNNGDTVFLAEFLEYRHLRRLIRENSEHSVSQLRGGRAAAVVEEDRPMRDRPEEDSKPPSAAGRDRPTNVNSRRKTACVTAVAFLIAFSVIYGLDHGVYVGSTSFMRDGIIYKNCRYLFVTGVSEIPSRDGRNDNIPVLRGRRLPDWPDNLYCRFFAE
jgi:hypothetical protein